jgi:hypothetical protein
MKHLMAAVAATTTLGALVGWSARAQVRADGPQYTAEGKLLRPINYREWMFVSSGLGMTYGPNATTAANPRFDNVFVNPAAYRAFMETGKWPDKTILILEIRSSASAGSINRAGHFQTDVVAVEAAVKDESRFPGQWTYYDFGRGAALRESVHALPKTATCYACHSKHTAVEWTFVQFYPTLFDVAKRKGTVNATYDPAAVARH